MIPTLSRRDVMKMFAATTAALQLPAAEPNAPLFFSKDEFELLDVLTELMIPTDSHSPGARAAGVAPYIDRVTAEAITAEEKDSWRKGLKAVDELSVTVARMPFVKASAQQQKDMMAGLAKKDNQPETPAEHFFTQLKQTTAFVYYTSSIGIHQEMEYKGNVLLQQFVGYDAT